MAAGTSQIPPTQLSGAARGFVCFSKGSPGLRTPTPWALPRGGHSLLSKQTYSSNPPLPRRSCTFPPAPCCWKPPPSRDPLSVSPAGLASGQSQDHFRSPLLNPTALKIKSRLQPGQLPALCSPTGPENTGRESPARAGNPDSPAPGTAHRPSANQSRALSSFAGSANVTSSRCSPMKKRLRRPGQ